MDIFAEKNLPNADLYPFFKDTMFNGIKHNVIGSYSIQSQRNAGDIDVDDIITGKLDRTFIEKEIKNILTKIDDNPNMYFIELKIQYKGKDRMTYNTGKKIKFTAFEVDDIKIPEKDFNDIDYIKIDTTIFLVDSFKDFSVIYRFNPNIRDIVAQITFTMNQELKEKKYYKVVKRMFSIAKVTDDKPRGLLISEFLNNYTGAEYKLLKNLEQIKILLENYDDPLIRKRIRVNLINFNVPPKISVVYKLIPQLQKKVNREAKVFLDNVLLKKNL